MAFENLIQVQGDNLHINANKQMTKLLAGNLIGFGMKKIPV